MLNNKLRASARNQKCSLGLFPYCNEDSSTVVLCHIGSSSKGMGIKSEDWFGVFGCSACHDIIDGRKRSNISEQELQKCILKGLHNTWKYWIENDYITTQQEQK